MEDDVGGLYLSLITSLHPDGLSVDPSRNEFWVEAEIKRLPNTPPAFDADAWRSRAPVSTRSSVSTRLGSRGAAWPTRRPVSTQHWKRSMRLRKRCGRSLDGSRREGHDDGGLQTRALVISDTLLEDKSKGMTDERIVSAMIRDLLSIKAA